MTTPTPPTPPTSPATAPSPPPDRAWISAVIALLGVTIGTLLTIGAQYWISYKGIEQPKIELEAQKTALEMKKAAIEVHKQALLLTPNLEVNCWTKPVDRWSWKVSCTTKNNGQYHADVQLDNVKISLDSSSDEKVYESGNGFAIDYGKKSYRATPGSSGDLWFYINFDRKKIKPESVART